MTSWIAYFNTDKPNPGCTVNFVEDISSGEMPPLSVGDEIICLFLDESSHKGKVVAGGNEYDITMAKKNTLFGKLEIRMEVSFLVPRSSRGLLFRLTGLPL